MWRENASLRSELEATRERHARELAQRDAAAREQAQRVVADAEEEAARVRADAQREVSETTSRLEHLLLVREQVLGELRGIVDAHGTLLAQVEQGQRPDRRATPVPGRPVLEHVAGTGNLFPRHVELDVGPFADFAELSAFERALARLPKVEDVYVRRFGADRAEIELTLREERPLVDDLTHYLPYAVHVVADDGNRLQLELEVEAAAAEG